MLTLDKIYHAAFVLKDVARRTDLIEAPKLSKDCRLYLKTENLQVTGSHNFRIPSSPSSFFSFIIPTTATTIQPAITTK